MITKILSYIVAISGLLIIFGWLLDIEVLKSIMPFWVTMKFSTALSFFLSGIILYSANSIENSSEIAQLVLPIATLTIILFMGTFLVSTFLGLRTGVEDLFIKEVGAAVKTSTPGRPSVGTMINFILVIVIALLTLFDVNKLNQKTAYIGFMILSIGSIAVVGYIFDSPLLYYTIKEVSTAMAIHTAILFILLGTGFIFRMKQDKNCIENEKIAGE